MVVGGGDSSSSGAETGLWRRRRAGLGSETAGEAVALAIRLRDMVVVVVEERTILCPVGEETA